MDCFFFCSLKIQSRSKHCAVNFIFYCFRSHFSSLFFLPQFHSIFFCTSAISVPLCIKFLFRIRHCFVANIRGRVISPCFRSFSPLSENETRKKYLTCTIKTFHDFYDGVLFRFFSPPVLFFYESSIWMIFNFSTWSTIPTKNS